MTIVGGLLIFAAIWFAVDRATRNHPGRKARDEQLNGPWPKPTGRDGDSGGWGGEDEADADDGDDGDSGDSGGDSGGDGGGDGGGD